ncbi:S-formylglutathione hydrolase isoform X1 [Brachionus plicatilis]|uniref:S-formylglutathione hydrolase n=1 Tax=Brachionus plicatilis TaxID=10195 RepID=A0A3M7PK88_BRAPC|nr:S-formylglutathione hydrolase isoform X1 [Brachionus plicatilis]
MTDPSVINLVSSNKCFEGFQNIYEHSSDELKCRMKFAAYIPCAESSKTLPVLIWLSGLTCTEQNFVAKSGFQKYAQAHKIIVIAPDTSPRGCKIEGDSEKWDFGEGAGFYVDATESKWAKNYRMYSYINSELHEVIKKNFTDGKEFKVSIFGHSMGGHGAMISFLKNPNKYCSVSAFAPISNPINCDWGKNAFTGYLGSNEEVWKDYDSCCLIKRYNGPDAEILVDQGLDDNFLKQNQLNPQNLIVASQGNERIRINLKNREGYDHSYYFISTFIEEHFEFHAKHLKD